MKNKILLRIVSLIMATSVVLTVGGCKKKDSDSGTTDASGNSVQAVVDGKGNAVQPSVDEKASTAVVKYTKVNADGKEEEATTVLTVKSPIVNQLTMGSKLDQVYKTDGQKNSFVDNAVKNDGIDKDKAEDIVKHPEEWVEFNYTAYVANTSSQRLITSFIEVGGKNDNIVLRKNLDCEYSIKSGSAMEIFISGLVNIEKYPDEESLLEELNGMKVKLIYTLADDKITDIDNWDEVEQKKMDIKFG